MVDLKDLPFNSALFGLVWVGHIMTLVPTNQQKIISKFSLIEVKAISTKSALVGHAKFEKRVPGFQFRMFLLVEN